MPSLVLQFSLAGFILALTVLFVSTGYGTDCTHYDVASPELIVCLN